MAGHGEAPDPIGHVGDARDKWEFFSTAFGEEVAWDLPRFTLFGHEFVITKFMILELVAAALILLIFIPIARRARSGGLPRGKWWNAFEALLTFVRNEIARPALGNDADKYVPYLWTVFLFILCCNLLGILPFAGSPTASIAVTAGLALCSFILLHGAPILRYGFGAYVKSQWPHLHIDIGPPAVGKVLSAAFAGFLFVLEMSGTAIKSGVLAIRLFANMFAGHMVLIMIMLFIYQVGVATDVPEKGPSALWGVVTPITVVGLGLLSILEVFVAFLQAYVFTFLTALFMGMALHPEH